MTRFLTFFAIALVGLLFTVPSNAGSYGGYNNYGHGNYFNYYPTIPTYGGYGYGYQSYYQPTYSYYQPSYSYAQPTYSYAQPSYSAGVNYKDGNYHYHEGQEWRGRYWPAGQYRWDGQTWIMQGADLSVPVAPDDWKQTLLKVSAKRDEYAAYLAALKAMGVSPPPESSAGGGGFAAPHGGTGYGVNRNSNLGTYGANASTLYGYTVQNVQSLYGDASTASLFQQAQQLATNAQALGGEATKQFQANVAQDGQNRQRTAEALARGLAAAEALRAAQGSESHQSTSETRYGAQPQQQGPPVDPQQGPPPAVQSRQQGVAPQMNAAFVALASAKCLKCHDGTKTNGNKLEGGFDMQSWQGLSIKEKAERVWPRLYAADPDKRMPKGGNALTPEEMKLFFSN